MTTLFNFEVHTPYRLFFSGMAQAITLPLADGEICVYAKHTAFTAPVVTGILRMKDSEGNWRSAFIRSGVLEVKDHKNVLMVYAAEWPQEIDTKRAITAKQRAQEAMQKTDNKFEKEKFKEKIRRAECRLKVFDER